MNSSLAGAGVNRRALIGGGAALAATSALPSPSRGAPLGRKPNIVFIMGDDLGAFDLSIYGRPDYRTPHIDSLGHEGIKFSHGYASSATCTPTRVGLLSGRYPNRVPVGTVEGGGATSDTLGYSPRWPSLARVMKTAGYRTGLIGKWNLGSIPNFSPLKCGYDEFFGFTGGALDYWSHDTAGLSAGGPRFADMYDGDEPVRVQGYSTDLFTARACKFIERHANRPFLLSLHYSAPHWPWQTRGDPAASRLSDVHFDGGSMRIYSEMMTALDDGVGKVLAVLDGLELARDTIVVFTSDNGGERFGYMWPLRGEKGSLHEGGVRVPLLVRWPAQIAAGTTTDQVAMSMDWLPTFAAIAGVSPDGDAPPDGVNLAPQLRGSGSVDRTVFWKTPGELAALAFPWKYLRGSGREYLFNLQEDVSENANYKLRESARFTQLKSAAERWARTMLPSAPSRMDELFDGMRSLEHPRPPGPKA